MNVLGLIAKMIFAGVQPPLMSLVDMKEIGRNAEVNIVLVKVKL